VDIPSSVNAPKALIDRRRFLKIKLKSLAEESKIIRKEEGRTRNKELRDALHNHRVIDVRSEARHTLIAYGFMRGRTFAAVEPTSKRHVDWKKVEWMVKKYGNLKGFNEWKPQDQPVT
jgi:hypothetical protein